ncbi:MAG: FprA family A-type flavoprotein [Candidatus Zixiibacteriota bacterium]
MSTIQIAEGVYWVGVKDPKLAVFDITMETHHGTTYNAYLVRGEKTALIDTVKKEFADVYLQKVESLVPIEDIDYLIVNHNEPDHSGAIPALLDRKPDIRLICSAVAVPYLKSIINREADITGVKDKATLDLGGKSFVFRSMPYMHWPDTMMDYLNEDRILFSNDGFAAHVSFDSLWSEESHVDIDYEVKYYFDAIMRPFTGYIRRNVAKLDDHEIAMVCPSHGPLYRKEPRKYIESYKQWSVDKAESENRVAIFYASNYGNTETIAIALSKELPAHKLRAELVDVTSADDDRIKEAIESSKAVVIGTPTFNGDAVKPIWDMMCNFSMVYSLGKKAAVFGSYGWGGEGAKLVADRLTGLRLKVFDEEYRVRLIPSDDDLVELREWTGRLAGFIMG